MNQAKENYLNFSAFTVFRQSCFQDFFKRKKSRQKKEKVTSLQPPHKASFIGKKISGINTKPAAQSLLLFRFLFAAALQLRNRNTFFFFLFSFKNKFYYYDKCKQFLRNKQRFRKFLFSPIGTNPLHRRR